MGRKTKLTPDTQEKIIQGIKSGLSYKRAAALAGICERTFYNWVRDDQDFINAVNQANAEMLQSQMKTIMAAGQNGQWQAAAWILERRFPEEFGRNREPDKPLHTEEEQNLRDEEYKENFMNSLSIL